MNSITDIAVVGAGPAGAYCAYCLAEEGFKPVMLDHSHPREKPCGGGISPFAQRAFPFLREIPYIHGEANHIQIVCVGDKRITLKLKHKYLFGSRLRLDQHILNMATANGARLEKVRVFEVRMHRDSWEISTSKGPLRTRILIGADGVSSVVRKTTISRFQSYDLSTCYGYFAKPLKDQSMLLKFLPKRKGYIWLFPRGDHICTGIAADSSRNANSKAELDRFLKTSYPEVKVISRWAAMIPTLRVQALSTSIAGPNWMLIGDAAGHVDPVSGEGIPYALRSAELAAEAIFQNNPRVYDRLWREDYGRFLLRSARMKSLVFTEGLCTPYFILASLISERLAA